MLLEQQHVIIEDRNHRDGTRVRDDNSCDGLPVRRRDGGSIESQESLLGDRPCADHPEFAHFNDS